MTGTPTGPEEPDDAAPAPHRSNPGPASDGSHEPGTGSGSTESGRTGSPGSGTGAAGATDAAAGSVSRDRADAGDVPTPGTPAYAPGAGSSPTGVSAGQRRRRWLRRGAVGAAVLTLAAGGAGWVAYQKLNGNITADTAAEAELKRYEKERPTALVRGAQNILLIGSDSRAGAANRKYGRDSGTQRSDTTILLHLAADRRSATAVSIPRDLMVRVPSCRKRDGSRAAPLFTMFNRAFEAGGSACTVRTVEQLTHIRVDHYMVIDFQGFKQMVDAVDGVRICLRQPVRDADARLSLAAGRHTLDGEQALGYVRARKSLGDGSDTDRMDRQQRFLGALVSKVRGNDVLLNPAKLYPVLDAATSALTTDPGLASLRSLYDLVRGVRHIPVERVRFLTVPRRPYVRDVNRDQLVEGEAAKLFGRLRADASVEVTTPTTDKADENIQNPPGITPPNAPGTEGRSPTAPAPRSASPNPSGASTPAPTFRGNTAAQDPCAPPRE